MILNYLVPICAIVIIYTTAQQLRQVSTKTWGFHFWGALSIGSIIAASSLNAAQIFVPEWMTSFLFAGSGVILALSIYRNEQAFPPKKGANSLLPISAILYILVCYAGLYSSLNESFVFPVIMALGYLPVLAISNRQIHKEYFQAAVYSAMILVAIVVLAQSTLFASTFFGECRLDKCSVWGMSIGNLSSGNALGLGLSFLGIMAVALAPTMKGKVLLGMTMFVLIDGSSGRTATFSFALATFLFIGTSLTANTRFRRSAIVSLTVAASLVFAVFPFGSEDFTRRGELWTFAREQISSNLFFGFGASGWVRQNGSSSYFLNYSSHNIWLEAAFSIGLVGLVLFFLVFMRQKGLWDPSEVIQLALFFWIVISGLTEVPSFITRIYLVPSALVLYFMLGSLAKNPEFQESNLKILSARNSKIFNR
jgi:hypothetical protein